MCSSDLTYEIMFRIFRETLTPRVGNWDQVHGYLIDLLLQCFLRKGSGEKLDVMDVMFEELWSAIADKRVPIYAPYIMRLICGKWALLHRERIDLSGIPLVPHLEKKLRKKNHVLPKDRTVGKGKKVENAPVTEPGWFQRVKTRLRDSFCLVSKRQYAAHVQEKKSRYRQKQIMRKLEIEVSAGSEEAITSEEEWLADGAVAWSDIEDGSGAEGAEAPNEE